MTSSRKEKIERVLYTTCFSQLAALNALVITNFIEASRTLLIAGRAACAPGHLCLTRGKVSLSCELSTALDSPLSTLGAVVRQQGPGYLITSGLREAVMGHLLRAGMFFPIFEAFKDALAPHFHRELYTSLIGSALTRTLTSLASYPLETMRVLSQSSTQGRPTLRRSLRAIWRNKSQSLSGFLFFWQKEMAFSAIFWSAYELLRERQSDRESLSAKLWAASVAGGLSAAGTFPFDVAACYRILHPRAPLNWWVWPALVQLWHARGPEFFLYSFGLRVLRGMTMNCAYIGVYQALRSRADRRE